MRSISIITVILFGIVLVALGLIFHVFRKLNRDDLLTFFVKGAKLLTTYSIIYFMIATLLYILYAFGALSLINIDWKTVIAGLFIFGFIWVLYNVCVITLNMLVVHKWKTLESECRTFRKC